MTDYKDLEEEVVASPKRNNKYHCWFWMRPNIPVDMSAEGGLITCLGRLRMRMEISIMRMMFYWLVFENTALSK